MARSASRICKAFGRRHVARTIPLLTLLLFCLATLVTLGASHQDYLSFVRSHHAMLAARVVAQPVTSAILFWIVFALLEAGGVPAGVPLMIASGILFGALEGGLLSVLGATAGAVTTFLAVRTALGNLLDKSSGRIREIQLGFRRNAFLFLLSTRLLPFFPFFAVNLVAGTFGIGLVPFIVASLIGLVPAACIYASLGAGMNEVILGGNPISLGALYQPRVLIPLIGLAFLTLLPLAWKKLRNAATVAVDEEAARQDAAAKR